MSDLSEFLPVKGNVVNPVQVESSLSEFLPPKERFPTTIEAMNALTLEGELGIGKAKGSNIPKFDITVPEGTDPAVMAK
jgi:hypothetical protein